MVAARFALVWDLVWPDYVLLRGSMAVRFLDGASLADSGGTKRRCLIPRPRFLLGKKILNFFYPYPHRIGAASRETRARPELGKKKGTWRQEIRVSWSGQLGRPNTLRER